VEPKQTRMVAAPALAVTNYNLVSRGHKQIFVAARSQIVPLAATTTDVST